MAISSSNNKGLRQPDEIFSGWRGVLDDFAETMIQNFQLEEDDKYVYRADSFAMTMAEISETAGKLKYKYQSHGQPIEVSSADITAYTSIFMPTTDTSKALNAFDSNAKKSSPRETVANYLKSQRLCPFRVQKSKTHINPYLDVWAYCCQLTAFLGPLPDSSYADPVSAKRTHPILPVLYHHFGCAVPTYEAIQIIVQVGEGREILEIGSGNGYWTYILRRANLSVTAIDNLSSEYRTLWISDTVKTDGVRHLRQNGGCKSAVFLMVYPITAGTFTHDAIKAYGGDTIIIVGTQNANRYTGFSNCTVEQWFASEMKAWNLICRVAIPSFAGKDDAMFIWRRG